MLENFRKTLGDTNIDISPVTLGTVKIGRNSQVKYPTAFSLPSDNTVRSLLHLAKELGINAIDTAPAYGSSEARLGKLLKNRSEWLICSKVGEFFDGSQSTFRFDKKSILDSVTASLKRLNSDYLDILLIHSDGNDEAILQNSDAVETLLALKQQGLIRAIGISGKTAQGGILALQSLDIAMITHNITYQDEQSVIDYANTHNKGILVKKALASGHLATDNPQTLQQNFDFILRSPIHSIVLGTINPKHLKDNCQMVANSLRAHD